MDSENDIYEMCRLCLAKEQVDVHIFEKESEEKQIFLKISTCLPIKISFDDRFPKKICTDCSFKLDAMYQFWNKSVSSEKQLLSWLDLNTIENVSTPDDRLNPINLHSHIYVKEEPIDCLKTEHDIKLEVMEESYDDESYNQPINEFPDQEASSHCKRKRDTSPGCEINSDDDPLAQETETKLIMESNKKRSLNFTKKEELILLNLIRKYKDKIESKKTDTMTNKMKIAAWNELTKEYNSTSGETHREMRVLKNKYDNLKKVTKRKFAEKKCYAMRARGCPPPDIKFTVIENQIKGLSSSQLTGFASRFDDDAEDVLKDGKTNDDVIANDSEEPSYNMALQGCSSKIVLSEDCGDYTPQMLRNPLSLPLKQNRNSSSNSQEKENVKLKKPIQPKDKLSEWVSTKIHLTDIQKSCTKEQHECKILLMKQESKKKIEIMEQESLKKLEFMEKEHLLRMEILASELKFKNKT